MNEFFKIDKRILDASDKALKLCKEQFENIEKITEYNQQKVQKAFIDNRISETHFGTSTGYGYGDIGRETLDKVWVQNLHLCAITLLAERIHFQLHFSGF